MTKSERQADAYAKKVTDNPHDYKIVFDAFRAGYFQHMNNWLNRE